MRTSLATETTSWPIALPHGESKRQALPRFPRSRTLGAGQAQTSSAHQYLIHPSATFQQLTHITMTKANPHMAAASRTRKAQAELTQLEQLLAAAQQQATTPAATAATTQALTAQSQFEDACAAHVLGEINDAALQAARVVCEQAQANLVAEAAATQQLRTAGAAALTGIQRRLSQASSELQAAKVAEREGLVRWAEAELLRADESYLSHAVACGTAMLRVQALRAWLEDAGQPSAAPSAPFGCDVRLPPLAERSHEGALAANPGLRAFPGHAWDSDLVTRVQPAAVRAALRDEIDTLTGALEGEPPQAKLLEAATQKVAAAARRLARSMTGKDAAVSEVTA